MATTTRSSASASASASSALRTSEVATSTETAVATSTDTGFANAGADAAGDGSPCATFQPEPIWTPTSVSLDLTNAYMGERCYEQYHLSAADGTLLGTCLAAQPGPWLVHLSATQVQAIIMKAQAIQSLCEPDCYNDQAGIAIVVQSTAPDGSTGYRDCFPFTMPPIETTGGVRYVLLRDAFDLLAALSDPFAAACDPDAGGGDIATCVPLAADGGVLVAEGGVLAADGGN